MGLVIWWQGREFGIEIRYFAVIFSKNLQPLVKQCGKLVEKSDLVADFRGIGQPERLRP
ncbi:hypothetical protein RsS62_09130 [Rhizobium dioscoreae]|nr:hypothetical protein RsS62_09130 [Rhizobium dioscoreae]